MDVPDFLKQKMDLYRSNGRIFRVEDELFNETSWLAVFDGQNLVPKGHHPVADTLSNEEVEHRLAQIAGAVAQATEVMPTHKQFIDRNCRADPIS